MKRNLQLKLIFISIAFFLVGSFWIPLYSQTENFIHDQSFNSNLPTTNGATYAVEVLNDATNKGKVLIGGFFNFYNGISTPGKVVRLDPNGALDNTFAAPGLSGGIYTIAVQPWDGKYIIGGVFTIISGSRTYNNIARLNTNGSIDPTFNSTGGGTTGGEAGDGKITKILVLEAERQIVVGGIFGGYKGTSIAGGRGGLIIINESGALIKDSYVTKGAWTGEGVYDMAFDQSGKILIGGEFGLVDAAGYQARRIARLNRNGSFDITWTNRGYDGVGPNSTVHAVATQPDGKIVIGGKFTSYVDMSISQWTINPRTRIARLNADGTLDNTFNFDNGNNTFLNRGFDNQVNDLLVDASGNIFVAGAFALYDNASTSAGRFAKLKTDGSRDPNFVAGAFNTQVQSIAFQHWQNDGTYKLQAHILAVGSFANYNSVGNQPNAMRFYVSTTQSLLVVLSNYIKDFTVSNNSNAAVKLMWKALQSGVTYYVERSVDGRSFEKLTGYFAVNANTVYTHIDKTTKVPKVYYRISASLTGTSKTVEYSDVKQIIAAPGFVTSLDITPYTLKLKVNSNAVKKAKFALSVFTLSGQQLLSRQLVLENNALDVTINTGQSLKNCLIILSDDNGHTLNKVFFK